VAKRRQTLKCPVCKIEVKAGRLDAHIHKVHPDAGKQPVSKGRPVKATRTPEILLVVAVVAVLVVAAVGFYYLNLPKPEENGEPPVIPSTDKGVYPTAYVRMEVASRGSMVFGLYGNETPKTVENFMKLVSQNFFTGTIFHRIVTTPDRFVIQGGGFLPDMNMKPVPLDPIKLEINNKLHNTQYTVAMARTSDPDSATTQFFINLVDNRGVLDPGGTSGPDGYAVFGVVLKGQDVVENIATAQTEVGAGGSEKSQPTQDEIASLIITNVMIIPTAEG